MSIIAVQHLKKDFSVPQKEPGLLGTLRSITNPKYNNVRAVDDITFTINEGELVGFIGPNGAGKTTTLKMLSGILYPTSGTVEVLGHTPWKREEEFLKNITLVMGQKNQLWWELPAIDTFQLNKAVYGIADGDFNKTLSELVDLLDLSDLVNTPVRKLSLGQRMRMELVAALLHRPKILFLDEPTIGLDVVAQEKIRGFISTYNKENSATILLTSHYMDDIERLATRIIIINHGKIIFDGKLRRIQEKFGRQKIIRAELEKEVAQKELSKVGEVVSYEFPHVQIRVNRSDSRTAVSRLLENFPVDDLTIEDPSIEEIIRGVFEKGQT